MPDNKLYVVERGSRARVLEILGGLSLSHPIIPPRSRNTTWTREQIDLTSDPVLLIAVSHRFISASELWGICLFKRFVLRFQSIALFSLLHRWFP